MGVIKFLRDISGLFNWNTDDNPTSEQDYMNAVKNWQETEKNLVDTVLWQPTTAYSVGNTVKTPSLPSEYCLVCTTAGTSGANEPTYSGASVGDSVSDGSVTWLVADDFNSSVKTYNASQIFSGYSTTYFSGVSGEVKVVGNHLVIINAIFALNATIPKGTEVTLGGFPYYFSNFVPSFCILPAGVSSSNSTEYALNKPYNALSVSIHGWEYTAKLYASEEINTLSGNNHYIFVNGMYWI